MKKQKITSVILIALAGLTFLSGCKIGNSAHSDNINSEVVSQELPLPAFTPDAENMFTNRDKKTEYSDYTEIILSDNGSSADSDSVVIDGNIITIVSSGTYVLRGSLSNGQIIVNTGKDEKVHLVLRGVDINCDNSAAIYVKQADKVFITLETATINTLSNKNAFEAIDSNNIDAVVFSKEDLTFNGSGKLIINAVYGHGVVSKDDLVVISGDYEITSAGHGLEGKDSVRIAGGNFIIKSGKDGIHADNTEEMLGFIYVTGGDFDITAGTDGFDASASLQIEGGTFKIVTGGGSADSYADENGNNLPGWGDWGQGYTANTNTASAKGLKANGDLIINSGMFSIDSSDDSLHSDSNVYISDGTFEISSGDDGIHADTKVIISGGEITILKSYEGIEGKSIDIAGGIISIVASDDGLNAASGNDGSGFGGRPGAGGFAADADCYIKISGGQIIINSSGDGIDSNGNVYVTGGETYVSGSTRSADGALDYDGSAAITGGIFVAVGSRGMAQNFGTSSTQGSMLVNLSSGQNANTCVSLVDEAGDIIILYEPPKAYDSIVISSPAIKQAGVYTLNAGLSSVKITMQSLIYGSGSNIGGQPGRPQGGRR